MSDPNFTPDEYRAQIEQMRQIFRIYPPDYAAMSFSAGVTGGMLMVAAKKIEALEKELDDMTATLKAANDLLEEG